MSTIRRVLIELSTHGIQRKTALANITTIVFLAWGLLDNPYHWRTKMID